MTYQPSHYGPPQPTYAPPQAAPKSRRGLWIGLAAALVVLALLVGGIFYAAGALSGGGLSKASAERACRTAFGSEWDKRSNVVAAGSTDIVASVNSIELQETWETDGGWSVNGTVHYTMTTALVAPVEDSINLTCVASGSDDAPTTEVANRG